MMKTSATTLLLLILLLVSPPCRGERSPEEQRIYDLAALYEQHYYHDPARAREYMLELQREATRQGNTYFQAYAMAQLAGDYFTDYTSDSLFILCAQAEAFAREHGKYRIMFTMQQTIILRYANEGKYQLALRKSEQMYNEAREVGDPINIARAAATMAGIYKHMDIDRESLKYYKESISLLLQSDDGMTRALTMENYQEIARRYLVGGEYEQALAYADSMKMCIDLRKANPVTDDTRALKKSLYFLFYDFKKAAIEYIFG